MPSQDAAERSNIAGTMPDRFSSVVPGAGVTARRSGAPVSRAPDLEKLKRDRAGAADGRRKLRLGTLDRQPIERRAHVAGEPRAGPQLRAFAVLAVLAVERFGFLDGLRDQRPPVPFFELRILGREGPQIRFFGLGQLILSGELIEFLADLREPERQALRVCHVLPIRRSGLHGSAAPNLTARLPYSVPPRLVYQHPPRGYARSDGRRVLS